MSQSLAKFSWGQRGGGHTAQYIAKLPLKKCPGDISPSPPDPFTQSLPSSAHLLPQAAAKFVIVPRENAGASGFNFDTTHAQPMGRLSLEEEEGKKKTKQTKHYPLPKFLGVFLDLSSPQQSL